MKTAKLIIGIILLIVGIVLYLLKSVNPWLSLAIAVVGLILIILSFCCNKKKKLPAVSETPAPAAPEAPQAEGPSSGPVEVGGQDKEGTPPAA